MEVHYDRGRNLGLPDPGIFIVVVVIIIVIIILFLLDFWSVISNGLAHLVG